MTRDEAIQSFIEANEIHDKAQRTLAAVLRQNPRAMLMVWEVDNGIRFTSIPFSRALSMGLVNSLIELATDASVEEDSDEGEADEC